MGAINSYYVYRYRCKGLSGRHLISLSLRVLTAVPENCRAARSLQLYGGSRIEQWKSHLLAQWPEKVNQYIYLYIYIYFLGGAEVD